MSAKTLVVRSKKSLLDRRGKTKNQKNLLLPMCCWKKDVSWTGGINFWSFYHSNSVLPEASIIYGSNGKNATEVVICDVLKYKKPRIKGGGIMRL